MVSIKAGYIYEEEIIIAIAVIIILVMWMLFATYYFSVELLNILVIGLTVTKTGKSVVITLVTPYGLKWGEHASVVQKHGFSTTYSDKSILQIYRNFTDLEEKVSKILIPPQPPNDKDSLDTIVSRVFLRKKQHQSTLFRFYGLSHRGPFFVLKKKQRDRASCWAITRNMAKASLANGERPLALRLALTRKRQHLSFTNG